MKLDYFKDLIWDELVELVIAKLVVKVPFFAFGPVNLFVKWVLGEFMDVLYETLKERISFERIAFKNDKLQKQFDHSVLELKLLARNNGIDSNEYRRALDHSKIALSEFIRFNIK